MSFLKFLIHNPGSVGWPAVKALGGHLADLSVVLILISGFSAIGKRFKIRSELNAFVIGEVLCGFLIMALGLLGLLTVKILWAVFIIIGIFGVSNIGLKNRIAEAFQAEKSEKLSGIFLAALILTAGVILSCAVRSGTPPVDWDSLAYHLAFPKIFLQEGSLVPLEWSFNIHYALNPEMIYTLLYAVRGAQAAHWMNFMHGLILVYAIYSFTKKHFSRDSAGIAAAIFVCQPIFFRVNGNAGTDFAVALAVFLAFKAWFEDDSPFLCGLLAGAAASSKITGLWGVAALAVLNFRKPKNLALFLAGAALLGFPWYVRNWVWKGNPFWPYFGHVFGSSPADLLLAARSHASVTEGFPKTFANWIVSPVFLTFKQNSYGQPPFFLIPAFLIFFAWSAFNNKGFIPDKIKKNLAFLCLFWTLWFWVYQMWRYFLPAAALISILIAVWASEFKGPVSRRIAWVLLLALVSPVAMLNISPQLFSFAGLKSKSAPGLSPDERYLEVMMGPVYRVMREANRSLPAGSKILLYKEVRGFYLNLPYAWGDPLNPGPVDFNFAQTAEDIGRNLRDCGFTHVFFNPYIGGYQGDPDYYGRAERLMQEFLRNHARPAVSDSGVILYEISPQKMIYYPDAQRLPFLPDSQKRDSSKSGRGI